MAARRLCNCCSSPFQFPARLAAPAPGRRRVGSEGTSADLRELFLLTCATRDGEIFLQGLRAGFAEDQGFAHGDGLLQAEHVLFQEHQPLMSGKVAPNACADEHQQGGRQGHGKGKHQVGCDEREETAWITMAVPGKDAARRAPEVRARRPTRLRAAASAGCAELVNLICRSRRIQDVEMRD